MSVLVFRKGPMQDLLPKIGILAAALAVAFVVDRLVSRALRRLFKATSLPSATIFINIVRVVVWALAILAVLKPVFGVEPTAAMAALGIGSVALSLGLQTTISNIIGGLTITTGKVVEPGDWVSVSGVSGRVTDITWRHTVVVDALGSEVVVPNAVMNSSMLTKHSDKGEHRSSFLVEVVPGADLDAVVAEATELVRAAVGQSDLAWRGLEPFVLMDGMNSFGGQMNVYVYTDDPAQAIYLRDIATRALKDCTWVAGLPTA